MYCSPQDSVCASVWQCTHRRHSMDCQFDGMSTTAAGAAHSLDHSRNAHQSPSSSKEEEEEEEATAMNWIELSSRAASGGISLDPSFLEAISRDTTQLPLPTSHFTWILLNIIISVSFNGGAYCTCGSLGPFNGTGETRRRSRTEGKIDKIVYTITTTPGAPGGTSYRPTRGMWRNQIIFVFFVFVDDSNSPLVEG